MVGYTCDCCRANFVNYDSSGIEEMDGSASELTMIVTSSEPSGSQRYLTFLRKGFRSRRGIKLPKQHRRVP